MTALDPFTYVNDKIQERLKDIVDDMATLRRQEQEYRSKLFTLRFRTNRVFGLERDVEARLQKYAQLKAEAQDEMVRYLWLARRLKDGVDARLIANELGLHI
ncbi:hypothetical protein OC846_005000 [Tilletia horrida]|uniref:Uncharacterized protein n=1 Tax=Tilletia horrida TaxID=155126 RepID=A0AAN6GMA4_9BASI|nr:hypothetical protein OC846_005000 [Tilletia horrida]KAK0549597.1 hypothetical protein OC845_003037 [Tilletia horrida]